MAKLREEDVYLSAVATDMWVFTRQAFATVYPDREFVDNWHVHAIIYQLQQAIAGKSPRLIINLPPRHLKSFLISVVLPAYLLAHDPSVRIICVSYNEALVKALSNDFRRIVTSEWYQHVFPQTRFSKLTETEAITDLNGMRLAIPVGGGLTGRGGDFIITDDTLKADDAHSDRKRTHVNDWFGSTLFSRLDDKQRSVMIVVMQRLHVMDLTGFLLADPRNGFKQVLFPAIARKDEEIVLGVGRTHCRKEGEILQPERENAATLEQIKAVMGDANFWAQYQQEPIPPEGTIFKARWLEVLERLPALDSSGDIYISIDTALTTADSADFTAISVVLAHQTAYYVVHAERGHWTIDEVCHRVIGQLLPRFRPHMFIIEASGVGYTLLNQLSRAGVPCMPYRPSASKTDRAHWCVPTFREGRVKLVRNVTGGQWIDNYIDEITCFPNGRYDDFVDSLTQLILKVDPFYRPAQSLSDLEEYKWSV